MERLTENTPYWIDDELWPEHSRPTNEEIHAVYCRLKEYEDTGLTPEDCGKPTGSWASVGKALPKKDCKVIVCTEKNAVYCTKFYWLHKYFGVDMNTHIEYWMPMPNPPKRKDET